MEVETQLPMTNLANCVQVNIVFDLSKSYLLSHTQLIIQKVTNLICYNIIIIIIIIMA